MSLTLLDIIAAGIILISAVLAMVRGFVREVLSIASWLIAAVAAYYLYVPLRDVIQPYIDNETLATIIAVAVVFIVVLVIVTYITMKIADLVVDSRIGSLDRIFGFIFGAVRGLLLVVVAFSFFVWLVENQPDWMTEAQTYPILVDLSEQLAALLPADIEAQIVARLHGEALPDTTPAPASGAAADATSAVGTLDDEGLQRAINATTPANPEPAPAPGP